MLCLGSELSELRIVGDQLGCPAYAQDIGSTIAAILERLKSKELTSGLYDFGVVFVALGLSLLKLFLIEHSNYKLLLESLMFWA